MSFASNKIGHSFKQMISEPSVGLHRLMDY